MLPVLYSNVIDDVYKQLSADDKLETVSLGTTYEDHIHTVKLIKNYDKYSETVEVAKFNSSYVKDLFVDCLKYRLQN